jgi:adenylate cyclase class IV
MARNIEIKARLRDRAALIARTEALGGVGPERIRQDDTFFACVNGRLKLREFSASHGQLIAYSRPDAGGPKLSDYAISETREPATLRAALTAALGQTGRGTLYLVGQTRVHVDAVEGLGDFVELEVVLAPGQSEADGMAIADTLMRALGIDPADLLAGAYVDLPRH